MSSQSFAHYLSELLSLSWIPWQPHFGYQKGLWWVHLGWPSLALLNKAGEQNEMKELVGWVKDKQISHLLLSQEK